MSDWNGIDRRSPTQDAALAHRLAKLAEIEAVINRYAASAAVPQVSQHQEQSGASPAHGAPPADPGPTPETDAATEAWRTELRARARQP